MLWHTLTHSSPLWSRNSEYVPWHVLQSGWSTLQSLLWCSCQGSGSSERWPPVPGVAGWWNESFDVVVSSSESHLQHWTHPDDLNGTFLCLQVYFLKRNKMFVTTTKFSLQVPWTTSQLNRTRSKSEFGTGMHSPNWHDQSMDLQPSLTNQTQLFLLNSRICSTVWQWMLEPNANSAEGSRQIQHYNIMCRAQHQQDHKLPTRICLLEYSGWATK